MKILLLSPHIDSSHQIAQALRQQGHALLFPGDAEEGWQMIQIHESNLDLLVIHREGNRDPKFKDTGEKLLARVKGHAKYAEIPVILTSEAWGDNEFAAHQETASGANAYLHWPFNADALSRTIREIFGEPPAVNTQATVFAGTAVAQKPATPAVPAPPADGAVQEFQFKLEDASSAFLNTTSSPSPFSSDNGGSSIILEAPPSAIGVPPESTGFGAPLAALGPSPPVNDDKTSEVLLPTALSDIPSSFTQDGIGNFTHDPPAEEKIEPTVQPFDLSAHLADAGGSRAMEPAVVASGDPEESRTYDLGDLGESGRRIPAPPAQEDELAQDMAGEMPYLFPQRPASVSGLAQPVGDAVVPGGAANAPDADTLKKYLMLREQDVAALSGQLKTVSQEIAKMKSLLREEHARNAELSHLAGEQKRRLDDFDKIRQGEIDSLRGENEDLRFQARTKADKARVLETQVRDASNEIERLKERVRSDLRKIRIREKELENRLEIVKKDSEALLLTRENKIIELKRKVDLLEFNMDLLQDQYMREKETTAKLRERLAKAAQVVRVAGGLLDQSKEKSGESGDRNQDKIGEKAKEAS
jgi:hypothetical protein